MIFKILLTLICILTLILLGLGIIQIIWSSLPLPINFSKQEWITIVGLVIGGFSALLIIHQIDLARKQITESHRIAQEDRKLERSKVVQEELALLRSLDVELANNFEILNKLIEGEQNYISGDHTHFIEYSVMALDSNISRNTFRFNQELLKNLLGLYNFFKLANNIFRESRIPGRSKELRIEYYTQILADHKTNINPFKLISQDLLEYINHYEGFASLQYKNTQEEGAKLIVFTNNNQLIVNNLSDEMATNIEIYVDFVGITAPKLYDPLNGERILARQLSMNYPLPKPTMGPMDIRGEGKIKYKSKNSSKSNSHTFTIKWDIEKSMWFLIKAVTSDVTILPNGISVEIGKVPGT